MLTTFCAAVAASWLIQLCSKYACRDIHDWRMFMVSSIGITSVHDRMICDFVPLFDKAKRDVDSCAVQFESRR